MAELTSILQTFPCFFPFLHSFILLAPAYLCYKIDSSWWSPRRATAVSFASRTRPPFLTPCRCWASPVVPSATLVSPYSPGFCAVVLTLCGNWLITPVGVCLPVCLLVRLIDPSLAVELSTPWQLPELSLLTSEGVICLSACQSVCRTIAVR